MKIGDEVFVHGFIDEIRKDVVIVKNDGGYFGTAYSEVSYGDTKRHGHWQATVEPCGWENVSCAECSVCGKAFVLGDWTINEIKEDFNYCPNCGAKMDESMGGEKK